jgi:cell wall-associated NlpC family hydrolase
VAQNVPGRHRAPGRFSAISELKTIAKESAQPAVKGVAIVAASGGLVATFAGPANAADTSSSVVAAPAAVGPQVGALTASNALSAIGYAKPALKQAAAKPVVIEDIKVKTERAQQAAAEKAAARKAAARKAAAERAAARKAAAEQAAAQQSAAELAAAEQAAAERQTTTQRASRSTSTGTRSTATSRATSTRSTSTSRSASRPALNPAPAPAPSASGIVGIAQSLFGVPYVYGGTTPSGFDCSGFTSYVYRHAGISIPRTASAQQAAATRVSSPSPGDLVFFGTPAYHVGIYVSPGRLIDAQRPGTVTGNHSIWTTPSGYGRF